MADQRVTATREGRLDPDALAALEEQHHFLIRSLVDLDREFAVGDIEAEDYEALRSDYRARADAVEQAIAGGKARFAAARRPRSPARFAAVLAAVAVVAVVAGLLVARTSGRRDSVTSVAADATGGSRQRLTECFDLGSRGSLLDATRCYGEVLKQEPDNPEALAYLGWFLYLAGKQSGEEQLLADGTGFVDRSIAADPRYPDAHAFKAVMLRDHGDSAGALAELDVLDGLNPSPLVASLVDPLRGELESSTTTTAPEHS